MLQYIEVCTYVHKYTVSIIDFFAFTIVLGPFCGTSGPEDQTTVGPYFFITFLSDYAVTAPGFRVLYTAAGEPEVTTPTGPSTPTTPTTPTTSVSPTTTITAATSPVTTTTVTPATSPATSTTTITTPATSPATTEGTTDPGTTDASTDSPTTGLYTINMPDQSKLRK